MIQCKKDNVSMIKYWFKDINYFLVMSKDNLKPTENNRLDDNK